MNHKKAFRKFGRSSAHRQAMLRNLAASLIVHERIKTTLPKAKELRRVIEPLITRAGNDTLHNRREVMKYVYDKKVVHKLFADLGPRYKDRAGGYTRVLKLSERVTDAAPIAYIELVDSPVVEAKLQQSAAEEDAPQEQASEE